ncbi:hypothetical protein [Microtetraspora malaysiensis]|uniref:hypothetical protein n=1 Tax=Microtetraspora malaysiensis TaxID=161358 RepID=UPI003D8ABBD4
MQGRGAPCGYSGVHDGPTVVLAVVRARVAFARLWRLGSVFLERAGGDGRDRPKSRMPGRLADRSACGPP